MTDQDTNRLLCLLKTFGDLGENSDCSKCGKTKCKNCNSSCSDCAQCDKECPYVLPIHRLHARWLQDHGLRTLRARTQASLAGIAQLGILALSFLPVV